MLCVFHLFSESTKKWQEKADLLTRLESQVKRMKENFDSRECLLLEEREKATEAHRYVKYQVILSRLFRDCPYQGLSVILLHCCWFTLLGQACCDAFFLPFFVSRVLLFGFYHWLLCVWCLPACWEELRRKMIYSFVDFVPVRSSF